MGDTNIVFKDEDVEAALKKFSEGNFTLQNGFATIPNKDIDSAWVKQLDDDLFQVSGFSMFLSSLAYQCQYHFSWALPTAGAYVHNCTFNVVINPWFYFEFLENSGQRCFVLMHEICHVFFEHMDRGSEGAYDPQLWNMAADYYINWNIKEMIEGSNDIQKKLVELIPFEKFKMCLDEKYKDMTEEEIYRALEQQAKEQDENGEGEGEGEGAPGSGGQKSFDVHGKSTNDSSSTANRQSAAEKVRAAATSVEQSGYKPGSGEAGLIRRFLEATEAKVSWQNELRDFVVSAATDMITYSRYNRRSSPDVVFPSKTGDKIRVYWGVDTSGSMGDKDLAEGARELQGVLNDFSSWELVVASCDTKAFEVGRYTSDEQSNSVMELNLGLIGGGGTDMAAMVRHAQEIHESDDEAFDVMIIFTDGEIPEEPVISSYEGDIPCIFLITEDGNNPSSIASAGIRIITM